MCYTCCHHHPIHLILVPATFVYNFYLTIPPLRLFIFIPPLLYCISSLPSCVGLGHHTDPMDSDHYSIIFHLYLSCRYKCNRLNMNMLHLSRRLTALGITTMNSFNPFVDFLLSVFVIDLGNDGLEGRVHSSIYYLHSFKNPNIRQNPEKRHQSILVHLLLDTVTCLGGGCQSPPSRPITSTWSDTPTVEMGNIIIARIEIMLFRGPITPALIQLESRLNPRRYTIVLE